MGSDLLGHDVSHPARRGGLEALHVLFAPISSIHSPSFLLSSRGSGMSFGPCAVNIFPAGQRGSARPVLTGYSDWSRRVSRERLLASSRASGIPPPTFASRRLLNGRMSEAFRLWGGDLMERKRRSGIKVHMPHDARSWLEAQRPARGLSPQRVPSCRSDHPKRRKACHEQSQDEGRR